MPNIAIIAVIPTPSPGTRYDLKALRQWMAASGHNVTLAERFYINVTFAERAEAVTDSWLAMLASAKQCADVLVLDLSYSNDLGRFYGHFDVLVAESLASSGFAEAILLFDAPPLSRDAVVSLAMDGNQSPTVSLHAVGNGWVRRSAFADHIDGPRVVTRQHSLDDFRKFTVRQRGIFKPRQANSNPYAFYYSIPLAEHRERLTATIEEYLVAEGITAVIIDSGATGDWFKSCVATACSRREVVWAEGYPDRQGVQLSEEDATQSDRFLKALEGGAATAAVAVPALRHGVVPGRVAKWLEGLTTHTPRVMTVFLERDREPTAEGTSHSGVLRRCELRLADGSVRQVDYFVTASLGTVDAQHWKSKTAALMRQQRLASTTEIRIDAIGAWSFLEACGAGVEGSVPDSRMPIRHYPLLRKMDEWDARWLATIAIDLASERLDSLAQEMVFFLPEESAQNGSTLLHSSLRDVMGVESFMIPRKVFERHQVLDSALAEELRLRAQGKNAIVFDEAAVTRGTLKALADYLWRALQIRAAMHLIVVDLSGVASTSSEVLSLMAWQPLVSVNRS